MIFVVIGMVVLYTILIVIFIYRGTGKGEGGLSSLLLSFTHSAKLEVALTIILAFILLAIASPSFTLVYSLDESMDESLKVIGHPGYWSYEYFDPVFSVSADFSNAGTSGEVETKSSPGSSMSAEQEPRWSWNPGTIMFITIILTFAVCTLSSEEVVDSLIESWNYFLYGPMPGLEWTDDFGNVWLNTPPTPEDPLIAWNARTIMFITIVLTLVGGAMCR